MKPKRKINQPCYPIRAKWGSVKQRMSALPIGATLTAENLREADSMRDAAALLGFRVKYRVICPEKTRYTVTLLPPKSA